METVLLVTLQILSTAIIIGAWITLPLMIIPGATIIWATTVLYVVLTGFTPVSIVILVFETLLMFITNALDNVLMGGSAKAEGASWWSIGTAFLGAVLGSIVFPPFGGIPGGLLFIFLAELIQKGDIASSWRSVKALMTGFGWASVARTFSGGIMAFWFGVLLFLQYKGWG